MGNFRTLKNKLKQLEPEQIAHDWFGSIDIGDRNVIGYGYYGNTSVYGYSGGLCCNFLGGSFKDNLTEGLEQIKNNLRKYTTSDCNILVTETREGKTVYGDLFLLTVYRLEGNKLIDKHPEGINKDISDLWQQPTETAKMSNEEWLSYFGTI